jgi:hypothetical protein
MSIPPRPHIYHVGEGVSLPKAIFSPTPEYTIEAAKKEVEGTVLLSLTVLPDGTSRKVTVIKGLGYGLDAGRKGRLDLALAFLQFAYQKRRQNPLRLEAGRQFLEPLFIKSLLGLVSDSAMRGLRLRSRSTR